MPRKQMRVCVSCFRWHMPARAVLGIKRPRYLREKEQGMTANRRIFCEVQSKWLNCRLNMMKTALMSSGERFRRMFFASRAMAAFLIASCFISCGGRNSSHKSAGEGIAEAYETVSSEGDIVDSSRIGTSSPGKNPFIYPHSALIDGIEAASDSIYSSISKVVPLGGGLGNGTITIENVDSLGLVCSMSIKGTEYVLYPDGALFASISLLDIDHDGLNEILVHDGDMFSLIVYGLAGGKPKRLGVMGCNFGFMLTDDGILVARIGSQGSANMAHLKNGKLTISEDEIIDKLLTSSKDYENLRYVFDDTVDEDRSIARIYPADEYIICDQGTIYGDHAFSVDLDGDGRKEQLYIGRPSWGMQIFDEMRVIIPGTRTTYDLAERVSNSGEDSIFKKSDFDRMFDGTVQLSAKDIDGDGKKEIIASFSNGGKRRDFVWSFDRKNGVCPMGDS